MTHDADRIQLYTVRDGRSSASETVVEVVVLDGDGLRQTMASLRASRPETRYRLTISHAKTWDNPPVSLPMRRADQGSLPGFNPGDGQKRLRAEVRTHGTTSLCRRDVVLVRAGTVVFGDWLDRLRSVAYAQDDIATVSPFTNGGRVCVYPFAGHQEPTHLWDWKALDGIANEANKESSLDIPVPGDCCVYLRRDYLDYLVSERRARTGTVHWRHVLAADTCVYDRSAERSTLVPPVWVENITLPATVRDAAVSSHVRADSARFLRRNIDVGRWCGPEPAMLLITHVGGGGTERHLRDIASALEGEKVRVVILRPTPTGHLRLDRFVQPAMANLLYEPSHEYYNLLSALRRLNIAHVHIQHLLGHPPATLELVTDLNLPYDWTIHDYFTICPRIHLMDIDGRYCHEPSPEGCNTCLARQGIAYSNQRDGTEIGKWRSEYARLLRGARKVFVPHAEVARRMQNYVPDVRFIVRGHMETLSQVRRVAAPLHDGEPLRIALLGFMVPHKGLEVLVAIAEDALRRNLPLRFHVIGRAYPQEKLQALVNVEVTGEYEEEDVFDLLESQGCQCALFLSQVPETYSFTLSIAMAAGLFPVGLDLGVQAARIRESGWGEVIPLSTAPPGINDRLVSVRQRMLAGERAPDPHFARYGDFLRDYYDLALEDLAARAHGSRSVEPAPPAAPGFPANGVGHIIDLSSANFHYSAEGGTAAPCTSLPV